MQDVEHIELTLPDGTVAKLHLVKFEEIKVSLNDKGEWVDASGKAWDID